MVYNHGALLSDIWLHLTFKSRYFPAPKVRRLPMFQCFGSHTPGSLNKTAGVLNRKAQPRPPRTKLVSKVLAARTGYRPTRDSAFLCCLRSSGRRLAVNSWKLTFTFGGFPTLAIGFAGFP